jgi:hypothetical protein
MKTLAFSIVIFASLAACSAVPQTPEQIQSAAQAQITATCPTAQAEVLTLQSLGAQLPANVNTAVNDAAPIIATMCAPGFVVSPSSMAEFLPAVTIVAVQYAAAHK